MGSTNNDEPKKQGAKYKFGGLISEPRGKQYVVGENWLNLGCGRNCLPHFDNVDYFPNEQDDIIIQNLFEENWKLQENHYHYIYASHFFEHIPHRINGLEYDGFYLVMNEIMRVAKNNAILEVRVPYPSWKILEIDQHCRIVSENTFNHFTGISKFSNDIDFAQRSGYLKLIKKKVFRKLRLLSRLNITDYHFRKYLKLDVGKRTDLVLIFRIIKKDE